MNISKMLSVFLILSIMTSISIVSLAKDQTNKSTEANITDPTNDVPVAEIEEAKLPSAAEEKERLEKAKKHAMAYANITNITRANIPNSAVPSTIPYYVDYSNPQTGISTFGTYLNSGQIYDRNHTNWYTFYFYLPIASYIYADMSANVANIIGIASYNLYMDNDWLSQGWEAETCNTYCQIPIQSSRLTYLSKGWHTLYLNGWAEPAPDDSYFVYGFISIMAFPEYTAITVTSPNGNENWYRGQTKSITWAKYGQPGANVKIELYKAGVLSSVISSKTPNDGIYSWYIPTYTPVGTDYKIKISSTSETKYYDWSNNNFKIY